MPGRISSPQTIAPTATIAADHPNAVVYPWTAASAVEWCDAVKLLVALAAIVLSSAVPIEPPICCIVLTLAEATLASAERTPQGGGVHGGRHRHTEAEAEDEQGRQAVRAVRGVHADPGEERHPAGGHEQAGGHQRLGADPWQDDRARRDGAEVRR